MMNNDLTKKYWEALDSFMEKVKQDKYVIAAILAGSLYHDIVWRKSDIDLILIVEDTKKPFKSYCLIENEIIINTSIYTRNQFKRDFESSLNSSQFHSWISKTTLLYTKDETLKEVYKNLSSVGEKDRDLLLLKYGTLSVAGLAKAQKFLYVKHDPIYSSYIINRALVNELASIEVILHGDIPLREVIHQALSINSDFFNTIYTNLLQQNKDENTMNSVVSLIESYLEERTPVLFKPIIKILYDTGMVVGLSELHRRISILNIEPALFVEACEWLVEKKIIQKLSSPIRLTTKSWIQVDEAAYYYDGGVDYDKEY